MVILPDVVILRRKFGRNGHLFLNGSRIAGNMFLRHPPVLQHETGNACVICRPWSGDLTASNTPPRPRS